MIPSHAKVFLFHNSFPSQVDCSFEDKVAFEFACGSIATV